MYEVIQNHLHIFKSTLEKQKPVLEFFSEASNGNQNCVPVVSGGYSESHRSLTLPQQVSEWALGPKETQLLKLEVVDFFFTKTAILRLAKAGMTASSYGMTQKPPPPSPNWNYSSVWSEVGRGENPFSALPRLCVRHAEPPPELTRTQLHRVGERNPHSEPH